MNYCDFLFNVRDEWKNNLALIDYDSGKSFTYIDLKKEVIKVSIYFKNLGIKKGDIVALHLVNSAEVVLAHLAVQFLGGITCLLDPLIPVKSLEYYLNDSNAAHIISNKDKNQISKINKELISIIHSDEILNNNFLGKLNENYKPYNFASDEVSTLFYTSGTTNKPKGVMLSPKNFMNHVNIFINACYKYSSTDRLLCFVPFSHGYGSKSIFLPCLFSGAAMVIMRSFHPFRVIEAIEKYKISHIFGVPSHFQQLLKIPKSIPILKKLKAAFTAAALLKMDTAQEWKDKTGIFLDEGYGLIETSTGIAFRINRLPQKLGDIGTFPKDFVDINAVDEEFNFLPNNERGEIVIKSESIMMGYLNRKDETKKAIINDWFRTGDMGYITDDNQIVLTGRIKDVINIAGIKVAPFEIEAELNKHPGISESAVIGVEDEMYGEIVIAFVKLLADTTMKERELVKFLQPSLMNFQIPKRIYFIKDFPRNNMGKIDKEKLKNLNKEIMNAS